MTTKILKSTLPLLEALAELPRPKLAVIIKYLDSEGRSAIYECIHQAVYNTTVPALQDLKKKITKIRQKRLRLLYPDNIDTPTSLKRQILVEFSREISWLLKKLVPLLREHLEIKINIVRRGQIQQENV